MWQIIEKGGDPMKILAFANQKGGVGKTTSAINVAASLGVLGKKVLLVDLDPQGNSTSGVGINKEKLSASTYEVLLEGVKAEDAIQKTGFRGLSVLPANMNLAGAELMLADRSGREQILKKALEGLSSYDYVILDCPPSLGLLTLNGLVAAHGIIVPMQCEYFALEGLSQLMVTVSLVRKMYNPALALSGVILTMYDGRLNLSLAVAAEIKKYFPDRIFRNTVPRNVRLSEAPSHGKPVYYYDKHSKGALAYLAIAEELEKRG
jgi:chromosome partitioning protein